MWLLRSGRRLNFCPHRSHVNGICFSWISKMWFSIPARAAKLRPQRSHVWGRLFWWTICWKDSQKFCFKICRKKNKLALFTSTLINSKRFFFWVKVENRKALMIHYPVMGVQRRLRGCFVAAMLTNVRLRLLVNWMVVGNERGLLAGLVVAQGASERFVVQVDDFVVNFQCFVRLKLLATGLANVNLK